MRTLGIEEELLIVDTRTGQPVAVPERILRRSPGSDRRIDHELQQQQLEIDTPPRSLLGDLDDDLRTWRKAAASVAARVGGAILASGTSPLAVTPLPTSDPRYDLMVDRFGITAAEQLTCGCHVHVSVESDDEGVAVLDRIRSWLPPLLALSANSPFWQGQDTSYASFRSQAWVRWPSAGPVDLWGSAGEYHRTVRRLVATGVLVDDGMAYFDARLSAQYPTVEIRVADVCLDPRDAVLLAGLCRALVETAAQEWQAGQEAPRVPTSLIRLAMWQAGRYGVEGDLLDPRTWRPRPAAEVLRELVTHLRPALEAAGDLRQVENRLPVLLRRGTGAERQRSVWRRTGRLADVVAELAQATLGASAVRYGSRDVRGG